MRGLRKLIPDIFKDSPKQVVSLLKVSIAETQNLEQYDYRASGKGHVPGKQREAPSGKKKTRAEFLERPSLPR